MKAIFGFAINEPEHKVSPEITVPQTRTRPKLLAGGLKGYFEKENGNEIWVGPKGSDRKVYVDHILPDEIVRKSYWKLAKAIKGKEDERNRIPRKTNVHPGQLKEVHYRRDFLAQGANRSHNIIGERTENTTRKVLFKNRNEKDLETSRMGLCDKVQRNARSNFTQQSLRTSTRVKNLFEKYKE